MDDQPIHAATALLKTTVIVEGSRFTA